MGDKANLGGGMRKAVALAGLAILAGCGEPKTYGPGTPEYEQALANVAAIDAYDSRNDWSLDDETSHVTGARRVVLSKHAIWTDAGSSLQGEDRLSGPRLIIRCIEGQTVVMLDPDAYLAVDEATVLVRFDEGKVEPVTLRASQTQDALGWWGSREARTMARRLVGAQQVAFQVKPYGRVPEDIVFKMADLTEKLPAVAEACGWPVVPTQAEIDQDAKDRAKARADREATMAKARALQARLSKQAEAPAPEPAQSLLNTDNIEGMTASEIRAARLKRSGH